MVVGAGIVGLVAARQLGLAGWDVELFEKSAAPRPDGYMMDFFGPGVEAAERTGLYPRLAAVAYHVEAAEYVDATGGPSSLDHDRFARLAGGNVLSLLRPDMERAGLAALDDVALGRCGSVTGRRYPGCGVMTTACGSPSTTRRTAHSPRTSSSVPMASIPECAPGSSAPKRSTCAAWACVLPPSS